MSQEKVDQYKKNKAVRGKNKRKNKKGHFLFCQVLQEH